MLKNCYKGESGLMKRILSLFLALIACLGMLAALPVPAKAAEAGVMAPKTIAADPYTQDLAFIKADGTLWVWSQYNLYGQLGLPARTTSDGPVQVLEDAVSVSICSGHAAAIKSDGSLWTWGENGHGQLGKGDLESTHIPTKVAEDAVAVCCTNQTTFFIGKDGTLWGSGNGKHTALGVTEHETHSDFVKIMDGAVSISARNGDGFDTSAAVKNDGSLWGWGANLYHEISSTPDDFQALFGFQAPVWIMDDVEYAASASSAILAVKSDRTLWGWGYNYNGNVGSGDFENVDSPVLVLSDVAVLYCTSENSYAVQTNGDLYAWGRRSYGYEIGDGIISDHFNPNYAASPVRIMDHAVDVTFCAALKDDGSLWAWGSIAKTALGTASADYWNARGEGYYTKPVKVMDGIMLPADAMESAASAAAPAGPAPAGPAADEPSGWARDEVEAAIAAGIVPDSLQGGYRQSATRAEFCALAAALYESLKGEITARAGFTDTTDENVEKMAALGVVNGVGEGRFDPDARLTREQAATMLSRLAEALGIPMDKQAPTFADSGSFSRWAVDAIGQMQASGIMNGTGDNTFSPAGEYTREQSIITMLRLAYYCFSRG